MSSGGSIDQKGEPAATANKRWGLIDFLLGFLWVILLQIPVLVIVMVISWGDISGVISNTPAAEASDKVLEVIQGSLMKPGMLILTNLLMYTSWLIAVYWASFKRGLKSLRRDFNLSFSWRRDLVIGLVFAVTARVLEITITTLLTHFGVDISDAGNSSFIENLSGINFFLIAILMAGIVGPFLEELFFRGLGLRGFIRFFEKTGPLEYDGKKESSHYLAIYLKGMLEVKVFPAIYKNRNLLGVIGSSLVFGLMHSQGGASAGNIFLVGWTGLLGVGFAILALKTNRLGAAIFAHAIYNLIGIGLTLVI